MLKLRNAVLTALLAFCLAMPFVSCSFNDGATGDVSGEVKVQSDNNQNGGNGGSTGGNEKPSGGDEDSGDNGNENPSGGNNGGSGNENPSGGNGGSTGENETPSGGSEKPTDPTEPGAGTTYVVIYNGDIIEKSLPESMWFYGVEEVNLEEGVDYTMKGNEITLTYSGYQKVLPLLGSSGGDGGQEPGTDEPGSGEVTEYTVKYQGEVLDTISAEEFSAYSSLLTKDTDYTISGTVITLTDSGYNKVTSEMPGEGDEPVPDVPVPDVPGDVEGTVYTVKYGDTVIAPDMPESALSHFVQTYGLVKDTDYTISGTVITLTESGFNKLPAAGSGAGE